MKTTEKECLDLYYPCQINYDGLKYQNAMAAMQAMRIPDEKSAERRGYTRLNGFNAHRKGKRIKERDDWADVCTYIMREIMYAKFSQNDDLKHELLSTGEEPIEHVSADRDMYWGMYGGKGKNALGKILMSVRKELSME